MSHPVYTRDPSQLLLKTVKVFCH